MLSIQQDLVFIRAHSVSQIIYHNKISKALERVCHLHKRQKSASLFSFYNSLNFTSNNCWHLIYRTKPLTKSTESLLNSSDTLSAISSIRKQEGTWWWFWDLKIKLFEKTTHLYVQECLEGQGSLSLVFL